MNTETNTQTDETQSTESVETGIDSLPSRDELIAAVREAGGTESVDVEAEAAAARARASGDPPPAATPPADQEPPIFAKLKAREEQYGKRVDAETYAAQLRAQAEQEAEQIRAEARRQAQAEIDNYVAAQKKRFQDQPTAILRELGDSQRIVDAVLAEDTPQMREIRELRSELAETKAAANEGKSAKEEIAKLRQERQAEEQAKAVADIRGTFLGNHATKEKAPYLHARYNEDEIFREANALGLKWKGQKMVIGKDFDYDDVVAYLERDAKNKLTSSPVFASAPAKVEGAAVTETAGSRPQGLANSPRTLSAANGSERRTSPKHVSEMTPAEERQALIEEVAAARHKLPKDTPL